MTCKRDQKPELFIINVDAIEDTLIAVLYRSDKNFIDAYEWLFLKPRDEWNNILMDHLKTELKWLRISNK